MMKMHFNVSSYKRVLQIKIITMELALCKKRENNATYTMNGVYGICKVSNYQIQSNPELNYHKIFPPQKYENVFNLYECRDCKIKFVV